VPTGTNARCEADLGNRSFAFPKRRGGHQPAPERKPSKSARLAWRGLWYENLKLLVLTGIRAWLSFLLRPEKVLANVFNGWSAATVGISCRRHQFICCSSECVGYRGRRQVPEFWINVSQLYSGWKTVRCCETLVPVQQDVPEITRVLMNATRTRISLHFVANGGVYVGQTGRLCNWVLRHRMLPSTLRFWGTEHRLDKDLLLVGRSG